MVKRRASLSYDVERIKLDRQGYDSRGRYYGVGDPVYMLTHKETGDSRAVRAATRADAVAAGRKLWGPTRDKLYGFKHGNPSSLCADIRALTAELKRARTRKVARKKRR